MNKIPPKFQSWFDARRRFRLSHEEIQMARELGMNPKKLGSLSTEKQQPAKHDGGKEANQGARTESQGR